MPLLHGFCLAFSVQLHLQNAMAFQTRFSTLVENGNDGIPFTLVEPVKALKYHPPLIELRVNKPNRRGAYRTIFFPFDYEGEQFLIYTRSVIKQDTSSAEFDLAVQETEALIPDFLSNPRKYIHLEEVTADDQE